MVAGVMTISATKSELHEAQAAYRAEIAALREMLSDHGPTGRVIADHALAARLHSAVPDILRLQNLIARLDD
jgi:hypothetical protein